jgi:ELWxxDGT repeat protein
VRKKALLPQSSTLRSASVMLLALVVAAPAYGYQLERIPTAFDLTSEFVEFDDQLFLSAGRAGGSGFPVEWSLQRLSGVSATSLSKFNANDVSAPGWFAEYAGQLYFTAQAGSLFRTGLYRTDGNSVELLSSNLDGPMIADLMEPTPFGGNLIYSGRGPAGDTLYKWDGASLEPVGDDPAWSTFEYATSPFRFGDRLLFRGSHPSFGTELFQIDGTTPSLFADVRPGKSNSVPRPGLIWNDYLYLSAVETGSINHMFRTNGASIEPVNFADGTRVRFPDVGRMTFYNDYWYFYAATTTSGLELARYDGTAVSIFADISPSSGSSVPRDFFEFEGLLYFTADGPEGRELYRTDGVDIVRLTDINPGAADANPESFVEFDGMLVFHALGPSGRKLYVVEDGAVQPFPLDDAEELVLNNNYSQLHVFDGSLYFGANDGTSTDLFRVSTQSSTPGDFNRDGAVDAADYTVWRDLAGQSGIGWTADANLDRQVDEVDFAIWKASFGSALQSAAALDSLNPAVPEPSATCLIAILAIFVPRRPRR